MSALNIDKTLVQQTDLFSSLPQNEVDFIVSHCGNLKLAKGSLLFSPDEEAKQFYILTSGSIRVYKRRDDGGEEEMALFTPGDTIGDFDFARGAIYDAFAEAGEDSELIEFPGYGHSVDSLAAEQPGTISNMLLNAIVMMTGRIKSANRLILDNMSWVQELHRRAYEDSSTGLWKQSLINDEITGVLSDPSALIMIKPDRFKILVDSLGHSAGDEAMIRIAIILKNMTRQVGNGWALRFKSNEVGLIFNNCDAAQAEKISKEVYDSITAMEPVPAQADFPGFHFTATISWAVWPLDNPQWDSFFQGNYANLLDEWKAGGERIIHYTKTEEK